MKSTLRAQGWCISDEGLAMLQEQLGPEATIDDIVAATLDLDLRQIGGEPPSIKGNSELAGPLVLELLEVRNVAMPSTHQVEKPRLFRVSFTAGGKKKFTGVEFLGPVDCITLMTPPGSKFMITKPIQIREQLLLLGPGMLKPLGGHVQEMVHAWRSGKQFVKRFRGKQINDDSGEQEAGPPPFVPFKIDTKRVNNERRLPKDKERGAKSSGSASSTKSQRQESRKDNARSKDKKKERETTSKDGGSSKKKDKDRSRKEKSKKKTSTGDEKTPNNADQPSVVNKDNKQRSSKKQNTSQPSNNTAQSKENSSKSREKKSDNQRRKNNDNQKQASKATEGAQAVKANNDDKPKERRKPPNRKPKDTNINNDDTNRSNVRPKNQKPAPSKERQKKSDDGNNKTNTRRPNKKTSNSDSRKNNDDGIGNK